MAMETDFNMVPYKGKGNPAITWFLTPVDFLSRPVIGHDQSKNSCSIAVLKECARAHDG
jgi:hypothetical protein